MQKKFMPILAVSGALSLSLVAAPGSALAADNTTPTKDEQALVQHMNKAAYEDLSQTDTAASGSKAVSTATKGSTAPSEATATAASGSGSASPSASSSNAGSAAKASDGIGTAADSKPSNAAADDSKKGSGTTTKPSAGKTAEQIAAEKAKAEKKAAAKRKAAKEKKEAAKSKAAKEKAAKEKAAKAAKERAAKKKAAEAKRKAAAKKAKAEKAAAQKVAHAKHAKPAAPAAAPANSYAPAAPSSSASANASSSSSSSNASSSSSSVGSTSTKRYKRQHYSQNMSTSMFVASIAEQARQIGQKYNLYASVMIAQAILESGSGSSTLSKAPNNNLFGIKGAYKGMSVKMATKEDNGSGSLYTIADNFRQYDTQRQSMKDYAKLLRNGSLYSGTWKENTDSYKDATKALQGRYATDTSYASKLNALIDTYDLTRFDKKLNFKITGTKETKKGDTKKLTMGDYANLEALATSVLGTDYVWGGNTRDGFDCSGLVQWLYKNALGINLTRTTYTQQYEGKKVSFDKLQMGDLLFFKRGSDTYHVAMYLGDGFYIHAPNVGDVVKIGDMETFTPSFAKRIISTTPVKNSAAKAKKVAEQKAAAGIK